MNYNNPPGTQSDINAVGATQLNQHYYERKALIEAAKVQFFGQLADVVSMPKNMGKKIKRYHYMPLLDVRNLNDQGIDAAGVVIASTQYALDAPSLTCTAKYVEANGGVTTKAHSSGDIVYSTVDNKWYLLIANRAIGANLATADTLKTDANIKAYVETDNSGVTATVANGVVTLTSQNLWFTDQASTVIPAMILGGSTVSQRSGNMYGSSKDIGTISGKLPLLSEAGGRVNRVGFKRKELEGTLVKMGFFDEYTKDSMDFDTDAQLQEHISREMVMGANEINEDALQIDLLNAAGVIKYAGAGVSKSSLTATDLVSYGDIMRLSIDLDNNRTPKHTKVITGSRMVDTKTIAGARICYIGSELLPTLKAMKDLHNEPAWIPVAKYADAGNTVLGEEGAIDALRFVVVPEMMKWSGAGSDATADTVSYKTNGRFDVFPMLIVGDESFTDIGFQTDGKSNKFKITHKPPGEATADRADPYGQTGFMSILWFYGFMALRPERMGLILTVAKL